jgi:hypothetical protein
MRRGERLRARARLMRGDERGEAGRLTRNERVLSALIHTEAGLHSPVGCGKAGSRRAPGMPVESPFASTRAFPM